MEIESRVTLPLAGALAVPGGGAGPNHCFNEQPGCLSYRIGHTKHDGFISTTARKPAPGAIRTTLSTSGGVLQIVHLSDSVRS